MLVKGGPEVFCAIHLRASSKEVLIKLIHNIKLICNMCLENTLLKLPHLPGSNELN